MREQVRRHAVAALVEPEAPREHAERVGAVHREEAPAVVGQRAQLAGRDQLGRVAHERRPAVVEADAADHAGAPHGALGAHGLLRRAADRLLAEHVLARLRGRLDQLDVQHVRRRDHDDVDRRVVDDAAPVRRCRAPNPNAATASSAPPGAGSAQITSSGSIRRARRTASGCARSERACARPSQPKPITPTPMRCRADDGGQHRLCPSAAALRSRRLQLALELVRELVELRAARHHLDQLVAA